ncbi:CBASS cGAMP-activated phospholipase [Fictibacillus barbaricus]|uniref:CBASS cGAMP-activated phospholipase n=1 Tax=Fictibacillus barbaricus TaxID=182136 RepID=UPI00199B5521|nr:CBASS cGAMP-activated phospholipase [Fictibacillus barbaricus]GGB53115.1 patatin [Fictibacillus barbaricus]
MNWEQLKSEEPKTKEEGVFRVLSIDGGGMKGVIPAQYLKRIEENTGRPIHEHFDLITGTSTGGIIALGLSIGLPAAEITKIYSEEGKKIFSKSLFSNKFSSAKYDNKHLKKLLINQYGEKRMRDAMTMLCIPSIEHHKAEPKVFKTPHHSDYIQDGERFMWEVGLATSAAPTYFPAASIGEGECKIDGGLWANNPILVAIGEAKKLGFSLDQIRVLSLGTGDCIYSVDNKVAENGGLIKWKSNLVDFTFQAQSKSATYTAKYLIGDNLYRITPTFGRPLQLDSTDTKDIAFMISEANHLFERTYIKEDIFERFFNETSLKQHVKI